MVITPPLYFNHKTPIENGTHEIISGRRFDSDLWAQIKLFLVLT